jgi:hypothetical protein
MVAVGVLARWLSAGSHVGVDPVSLPRNRGDRAARHFRSEFSARLVRIEAFVEPVASARMVAAGGMINEGISRAALDLSGIRPDMAR